MTAMVLDSPSSQGYSRGIDGPQALASSWQDKLVINKQPSIKRYLPAVGRCEIQLQIGFGHFNGCLVWLWTISEAACG